MLNFKNLFKREKLDQCTVCSPLDGEVIELIDVNDGVFSDELLGKGCAIIPDNGELVSPFDGTVMMCFPTKHAIGLKNEMGVELLIHIGLETVNMDGKGFNVYVKQGDKVKMGDLLISFPKEEIQKSGFSDTTMIVITNTMAFREINLIKGGKIKRKEPILSVKS